MAANRKPRGLYQTSERQVICPRCGERDWEGSVIKGQDFGCQRAAALARYALGQQSEQAYIQREAAEQEAIWQADDNDL